LFEKEKLLVICYSYILPLGEKEVLVAGDILAGLRKSGQIIGLEDVLIGAAALANQYTVVTANTRHFSRIKGLRVENWLEHGT